MSKYYDLDKLKELIEAKAETLIGDGAIAFHAVGKWLDLLPAANVATVRHGHYREVGKRSTIFVCSACDIPYPYKTKYCPNCGAKMDEDGDDE